MKRNKNIEYEIEQTFESIDKINQVEVPPFFKERTMKRLFNKEEEEKYVWSWLHQSFNSQL